jgi:ferredoxin-NADP reductase
VGRFLGKSLLPLVVTHAFSKPLHADSGSAARLDAGFIARHLPQHAQAASYFICGPAALMEMAQQSLLSAGVSGHRIHHERFGIV